MKICTNSDEDADCCCYWKDCWHGYRVRPDYCSCFRKTLTVVMKAVELVPKESVVDDVVAETALDLGDDDVDQNDRVAVSCLGCQEELKELKEQSDTGLV